MRPGYRASVSAVFIILAVLTLSPRAMAQQAKPAASSASSFQTPRTPWGDPDFQGIWNAMVQLPMQRRLPGQKPQVENDEGGPPILKDLLGKPTTDGRTGDGPEFWYEFGLSLPNGQKELVVDPPDGRIPPKTPAAQKRRQQFELSMAGVAKDMPRPGGWVETMDPWLRCITRGVPGMYDPTWTGYNMNFLITQGPGWVAILSEQIHETRVIPLESRAPLPDNVRQWLGDSRGRWEGNTLVIETTNFSPEMNGNWHETNWYSGPNTKVTERYTRLNENFIDARYTIDDPVEYTRPWTFAVPWNNKNAPDRIFEYGCHEGNYGLGNILSGARAREKEQPAKKASSNK